MLICKQFFQDNGGFKMSEYLPEGKLISTRENINILHSPQLLKEAMQSGKILEAKACVCDANHNLIVDLGGVRELFPERTARSE